MSEHIYTLKAPGGSTKTISVGQPLTAEQLKGLEDNFAKFEERLTRMVAPQSLEDASKPMIEEGADPEGWKDGESSKASDRRKDGYQ